MSNAYPQIRTMAEADLMTDEQRDAWIEAGMPLGVGGRIEITGVRDMNSRRFRKTFKSEAAFEKWLDKHGDEVEVHAIRNVD